MDSNNTITWTTDLSIGNPDIDKEHARIIQLYNELAGVMHETNYNSRKFAEVLSGMFDYSMTHFRREEMYMKRINYPELAAHKQMHKEYTLRVTHWNADFFSSNPPDPMEVLLYLAEWWQHHIRYADQQYETYKRSKYPGLIIDWSRLVSECKK